MSRWLSQLKNPSSNQSSNQSNNQQANNESSNQFDYSSNNQSINQTINQFILHACDPHEGLPLHDRRTQSFYQSIKQTINQSIKQSNKTNDQVFSIGEMIDWMIENHWTNDRRESLQLIDRLIDHSAIQAANQSNSQSNSRFDDNSEFRWINQSINQSVNRSDEQSINLSLNQSISQSDKQWRLPTDVLLYSIINSVPGGSEALQSINQSNSQSINQSIKLLRAAVCKVLNDQSSGQTDNQSINQSINQWKLIKHSKGFKRYTMDKIYVKNNQSINRTSNQSTNQSITEHIAIPKRSKQSNNQSSFHSNNSDDYLLINQSNNDPFDQSIAQSQSNESINQSINQSRTYHSHLTKTVSNISLDRSINRSTNQSINQTINQYLGQLMDVRTRKRCDPMISNGWLIDRLIDQSTGIYYYQSVNQINNQAKNQSTKPSNNQSINQSNSLSSAQTIPRSVARSPNQSNNQTHKHTFRPSKNQPQHQTIEQLINQSINQPRDMCVLQDYFLDDRGCHIFYEISVRHNDAPVNQPIDQTNNQSNNQSSNQLDKESMYERAQVLCSIRRLRAINQLGDQSINQSNNQSSNPTNNQSNNQSICELTMITQVEYTGSSVKHEAIRQALINQSINQSDNQSVDQSINEFIPYWLIDQWAGHPSAPSINQSVDQSINQCFSLSQSAASLPNSMFDHSINQSHNQSMNASSVHTLINQSINQSINHSVQSNTYQVNQLTILSTPETPSTNQPISQTSNQTTDQEITQSNNQVINQTINLSDLIPLSVIGRGAYSKILQVIDQTSGVMYAMKVVRKINQSINQSMSQQTINQSNAYYQSNNQLYNQSINQSISREEARLLNETIILSKLTEFYYFNQPNDQSINQSNYLSINPTTNQLNYLSINQSINRSINQPNYCCHLIAAYQSVNRFYLLVPYSPGGDLFSLLRKQSFQEKQIASFAAGLLVCLRTLHSLNIWHRDIKPENILIDAEGQVCLVDFGLSHLADPSNNQPNDQSNNQSPYLYNQSNNYNHYVHSPITHQSIGQSNNHFKPRSYSVSGTSEYMSPEQLRGDGHDQMTDWWQYGVVLCEMLTGRHPFFHRNIFRLQQNILNRNPILEGDMSFEARDLLTKLLEKDPEVRLGGRLGDIESHPFFVKHKIDWGVVARRTQVPDFVPPLASPDDVTNFDPQFTIQTPTDTPDFYNQSIDQTNSQSINQLNQQFSNQLKTQMTNSSDSQMNSSPYANNQLINQSNDQSPVSDAGGYAFYMRPSINQSNNQTNVAPKPVSQLTQQLLNKALAGNI